MGLAEAKRILADSEKHSRRLVEQAQEVVEKFTKRGEKPMKLVEGKTKMAYGGTVMGKRHMYVAGGSVKMGSVKMNPGLMALRKESPEAFAKITKGKKLTT